MPTTSKNSVRVAPGDSAITRSPVPRDSCHSASVKLSTNAFAAAYTAMFGAGKYAAMLATLISTPVPAARSRSMNARLMSTTLATSTLISSWRRRGSSVWNGPKVPKPALLTRLVTVRPRRATSSASA